jgi:outer membrane protein assembly factor BamB
MWLDKVLPGAEFGNDIRWQGYELTITAPDGTNTTQTWASVADPTANQDYSFTPSATGTYTFTFTFPGQTYNFPPTFTMFGPNTAYIGDYYEPSSASTTVTVQQAPITNLPTTPLPTQYWTRPIYGENSNWYTISSNWLGSGAPGYGLTNGMFTPDEAYPGAGNAVGPQTSHIMWTKPLDAGGVVGGNSTIIQGDTYFEGSCYNARYTNPIIIDGLLFYTEPISFAGAAAGPTVCVNLQTGQQIWSNPNMPALSFGYLYDVQDPNQHGIYPPILFAAVGGGFFGGPTSWQAYDAYTGDLMFTVTNIPSGVSALGPEGEHLIYVLANDGTPSNPQWYLAQWNSSRLWGPNYSGPSTSPPVVPPILDGSWTGGYMSSAFGPVYEPSLFDWNVSIPSLDTDTAPTTILAAYYGDMLLCMNGTYPAYASAFTQSSWAPYTYFAINLNANSGQIGSVLWRQNYDAPPGNITVSFGGSDPTVNVFFEYHEETMQWVGYSMTTGEQIWGPVGYQSGYAFYNYDSVATGQNAQTAYGNLYSTGFEGLLYCIDLTNGKLLWTYGNGGEGNSTNSGLATAHSYYPMVITAIGNGIVYTVTSEHTVETPIYKGALVRAINATSGKEIWTLSDDNNAGSGAIADGYITFFNGYDNQIYVVGRGPSATSVTASPAVTTFGDNVVIRGTVLDVSAGTKQDEQAADFQNGVPCASDASMSQWMSYVYQQQPEPTNFTGVPVTISVTDSNHNTRVIGTATTDSSGMYTLTWTPDIPGNFTVYANFAGTNGYWPSSAETSFNIMNAPVATASPTQAPLSNTTNNYVMGIGVVIIIVIVVIGALIMMMLRKRP